MVRIIDGEIVQDDDPRLQARQRAKDSRAPQQSIAAQALGAPRPAPPAPAQPVGFDWSAPPFRVIPNEFGSTVPDVEVYGLRVPGLGVVAVAAAGLFFGWRGLVGSLILGYLYLTRAPTSAPTAAGGSRPAAAGSGFMQQQQQQQNFAGAFGATDSTAQFGGSGGGPGAGRQPTETPTAGSPWSGKGHKLGSS